MVIYKINIRSASEDFENFERTEGEITLKGGAVIFKYRLDGDECIITVNNGKVTYKRLGEQCVEMQFEESVKTFCNISSGGLSGSYEVYTKSLKFTSGKGGYKLSLEYLNGADKQLIKLILTALKKDKNYEN